MTTIDTRPPVSGCTPALRNLYLGRFAFAILWALLLALTTSGLGPLSIGLLLLYPLVDLAAAVIDHRTSGATKPAPALFVNMALSLLAVVGIAIAAASGLPAVLIVWGVWAITTGIVQLIVAVSRRALGGQWPMIISGGLSVLAGGAFIAQSGTASASLSGLAGYAALGGLFFLVSALRLQRITRTTVT